MPLLSICIPTRNREFYCIKAIENILSCKFEDFELVVQDNSDSNIIEDYLNTICDNRVVYNHDTPRINSAINMDKVLAMAKGEYVIMIGDDDTILPSLFEIVSWAKENSIVSVSPMISNSFLWESEWNKDGGVYIEFSNRMSYQTFSTKKQLVHLLRNGIIDYQEYRLPRVYHGLIKREVLTKLQQKQGLIIGGLSPDICLAVGSALLIDETTYISKPISIAGACPISSTAEASHGGHIGTLAECPHLYQRDNYEWEDNIPPVYSVETIWAESALKTIRLILGDNNPFSKKFNNSYFVYILNKKNAKLHNALSNYDIPSCSIVHEVRYRIYKCKVLLRALKRRLLGRTTYIIKNAWTGVVNLH